MLSSIKKFNKEIRLLKSVSSDTGLHPLVKGQLKQNILQKISPETRTGFSRYTGLERREKIMRYIISALLGLSLVGGTAFASSNAVPGETLFTLKRAKEKLEIRLATTDQLRAEIEARHAQNRLDELSQVRGQDNLAQNLQAAENETQAEINIALRVLADVKAKLEAQGNTRAAAALGENAQRIRIRAQEQNLSIEIEDKNEQEPAEDQNRNEDRHERGGATSTSTPVNGNEGRNGDSRRGRESGDSHTQTQDQQRGDGSRSGDDRSLIDLNSSMQVQINNSGTSSLNEDPRQTAGTNNATSSIDSAKDQSLTSGSGGSSSGTSRSSSGSGSTSGGGSTGGSSGGSDDGSSHN